MTHPAPLSEPRMSDPDIPEITHAATVIATMGPSVACFFALVGFVESGSVAAFLIALVNAAFIVALARDPEVGR